jgi:predicted exporter
MDTQERLARALDKEIATLAAATPGLETLRLGTVFFARAGAEQAVREISTFSAISLAGTVVIVLLVFRAIGPLWQSLLTIGVGLLCAFAASLLIFPTLHVTVLLFGSSLIGVTVDYSTHWFCASYDETAAAPDARLRHLLPGLTLGVATTLIGYLAFLVVPIPGFHQMAVFSAVGVAAAFITVVLWLPLLERRRRRLPATGAPGLAAAFWRFWEAPRARPWRGGLLVVLAVAGGLGATRLSASDDIRAMQFLSQELLRQQAAVRQVTGSTAAVQHFLVRAPDGETALRREEALIDRLSRLRAEGALAGFQAPAQFVPSAARQGENRRLVRERLMAPHLARHLDRLGLSEAQVAANGSAQALTLETAAGAAPLLRRMILPAAGEALHVVLLETPLDPARVAAAAAGIDGIRFVDPAADISRVLAEYRRWAIVILGASVVVMLMLLMLRYRFSGALRVMAPPVAGIVLAPALAAAGGDAFTFFDALALVLVLAISVDYAVFCAEAADDQRTWTMLAVALAATTTLLSFGMLAFSRVPAVQSFGLTIVLGIGIAFLLAPAAGAVRRRRAA